MGARRRGKISELLRKRRRQRTSSRACLRRCVHWMAVVASPAPPGMYRARPTEPSTCPRLPARTPRPTARQQRQTRRVRPRMTIARMGLGRRAATAARPRTRQRAPIPGALPRAAGTRRRPPAPRTRGKRRPRRGLPRPRRTGPCRRARVPSPRIRAAGRRTTATPPPRRAAPRRRPRAAVPRRTAAGSQMQPASPRPSGRRSR
mmetsp:Transcript_63942/g.180028  ORF Transcript_63942/g.180028 Transcript_63942/m.180028 type:complete len:204 (+) Transcript_63942:466-1077(+)